MIENKQQLRALYTEFADEDRELAEAGVADYADGIKRDEFIDACNNLNRDEEQTFAEIGASADLSEWPEY